jgi:hypothetical protein
MATPHPNGRFTLLRQTVIIVLGVVVILNATFYHEADVIEWTAGLILIGLVPIEAVFAWWRPSGSSPKLPEPPKPPQAPPQTPDGPGA